MGKVTWAPSAIDDVNVTLNGKQAKAMADQLATVSKQRLLNRAGVLSKEDMQRVGEAVKVQLDLA